MSIESIRRVNDNLLNGRSLRDADLPDNVKQRILERRYSQNELNSAYERSLERDSSVNSVVIAIEQNTSNYVCVSERNNNGVLILSREQEDRNSNCTSSFRRRQVFNCMSGHDTFSKLVISDVDFVGMVAYTIYKKDKNAWKASFKETKGQEPEFSEINLYFNIPACQPEKITTYRNLAENRLNSFIDETILNDLEQYKREVLTTLAEPKIQTILDTKIRQTVENALTPIISNEVNTVSTVAQRIEVMVNPLEAKLDKFKPTFWGGVWQNIAATVVTAIIVALVSTGFWFYKIAQNDEKKEALKQEMKKEFGMTEEQWQKMVKAAEDK